MIYPKEFPVFFNLPLLFLLLFLMVEGVPFPLSHLHHLTTV
jgi:hypothetical protein